MTLAGSPTTSPCEHRDPAARLDRRYWTVYLSPQQILVACEGRIAHHTARMTHWIEEYRKASHAKVDQEITLDLTAVHGAGPVGPLSHLSYNGASSAVTDAQQRVSFAQGKLYEHRSQVEEYTAQSRFLKAAVTTGIDVLPLSSEDYTFFFGMVAGEDEETRDILGTKIDEGFGGHATPRALWADDPEESES